MWEEHRDPEACQIKPLANGQQEKLRKEVEPGVSLLTWS